MSRAFFTADLHLGHSFVANLRGYATTDEHDAAIAERWDATVGKRDTVWLLGDVTLAPLGRYADWLAARPGVLRLVYGNHDRAHPLHRKPDWRGLDVFTWHGLHAQARLGTSDVLLSHLPYDGDSRDRERHEQWRLRDLGTPLIHGHTHSVSRRSLSQAGTAQLHVGWDAWHRPVHADELAVEQQP